jgi:CubicO group peptidase (beta-lactamase class C family)
MTAPHDSKNSSPTDLRRRLIPWHFARKSLILIAAILSMASTPLSHADDAGPPRPENLQELDQALGKIFTDGAIPGASVAIIENGRVVFTKGYGVSDTATKKPVTPDTVFRAGSISKSLTGIAIMTAVEAGKLSLDGKLSELAPDVKFDNPWEAGNPIRLVNLLEHTTGWPDISFRVLTMDGPGWSLQRGVKFASTEFVSRWQPGRFAVYNNSGPAVAGLVLERASGQEFNSYMRAHVLRPMGMASSDFELTPTLAKRLSKSYLSDGRAAPFQNIVLGPSGSLDASAPELAQLVRFYLGRGTIDGHRLLTARSIERIERGESSLAAGVGLTTGSYGLGNTPSFDQGVTFRGHNGSIDSFTSVYAYTPQNNSGYVQMANGGEGVDFADPASRLVQSYLTRHSPTVIAANVPVDSKVLASYAGLYRRMTPDNAFTRPFQELLGLTRVSAGKDKLIIGGKDFFPASQHLFRRAGRDSPNMAFVEADGETYMVSAKGATVKEPMWRAILIAAVLATLALGLVVAIFMSPVWLVAWARGRLAHGGGALIRFLPLLAFTALGICFALPFAIFMSGDVVATRALATPGMVSITVFVCSLLYPLLSGFGLWRAIRGKGTGIFVRAYVGFTSSALLVYSAYAASIGWVGVRTWMM